MPARRVLCRSVRLVLTSAGPLAGTAAEVLAAHLSLSPDEAAARMARPGETLAEGLAPARARRIAVLLGLVGAVVRTAEAGEPPQPPLADIALHPVGGCVLPGTLEGLAAATGRTVPEVARALASATGLVLRGQSPARVTWWRGAMARLPGLRLILSDPATARFDLIPLGPPADPGAPAAMARHLARLGTRRCAMTGAVACDLDAATCAHLMRRFPGSGAVPVNRAFQRFDLLLEAAEGLTEAEVRDFLTARAGPQGGGRPAVVERGLPRGVALAFQADYAAIGLRTRARLCGVFPAG